MYCANCLLGKENCFLDIEGRVFDKRTHERVYVQDAVTMLGGAALCFACFWLKIKAMKEEQEVQKILKETLAANLQEVDELKKKL